MASPMAAIRFQNIGRARGPVTRALLILAVAGCGGGSSTGPSTNGGGSFTAVVDGATFVSDASYAEARHSRPGQYDISGTKITGSTSLKLELDLANIGGPGTYPLGVADNVFGGIGWVINSAPLQYWVTPFSGASGTVTISTLSDSRIAGSFSYATSPYALLGTATGNRNAAGGTFDVPIKVNGTPGALTANKGGKMSATVRGQPWNAANVTLTRGGNNVTMTGDNTTDFLGITLTGVTAPGTYPLSSSPIRIIIVTGPQANPNSDCCWGGGIAPIVPPDTTVRLADVGTVTITTFSATRVVGTFSATLAALTGSAAKGTLVITNGTFDIGIP